MKLLQFNKESYEVIITEEAAVLAPFKKIIQKDKSKDKAMAIKELSFVYFYADLASPYNGIVDDAERAEEIIKDIELPLKWTIYPDLEYAIHFYKERSKTAVNAVYEAAMTAMAAVNSTLKNSKQLIDDAKDSKEKIEATKSILTTIEKIPKIMQNLRDAEKELIRQIEDKEGKKIGSKQFNTFEDIDGLMK